MWCRNEGIIFTSLFIMSDLECVLRKFNENAQKEREQYLKIIENTRHDSQAEVNLLSVIITQLLDKLDISRKKEDE